MLTNRSLRRLIATALMMFGLIWSNAAQAQDCGQAATQGSAPPSWQTYCWLNLANYNDATARSASGQNLSFTLPDGSIVSFNARVTGGTGTAYNSVTAPSWTGAAIGNSSFIGIPGRPALYTASAGTRTITLSGITIVPPAGASASVFAFIVADAESSNQGETLRMGTNGGNWQLLDSVPPTSGNRFPTLAGVGTRNASITGITGTVGAHILSTSSPTTVTVETVAGGLQGVMFAVRFASIRLQKTITGPRVNSADQFRFEILSTGNGSVITSGTTTGSGNGPFSTRQIVMAAGLPITLRETMAAGSPSRLAQYTSSLTCVNSAGPTRAALPNNLAATSFNLGVLEFGEALVCTFTNTRRPTPNLSITKVSAIIADPVNGNTNPKAIPGALVEYLITVSNTGPGAADADSLSVVDQGPGDVKLCRIARSGGPIVFNDPGGNSGVTYGFATIASSTDDLEFSNNNGASFGYTPTPDADDCDTAVTDFRVRPDGAFASGGTITLRVRYILE